MKLTTTLHHNGRRIEFDHDADMFNVFAILDFFQSYGVTQYQEFGMDWQKDKDLQDMCEEIFGDALPKLMKQYKDIDTDEDYTRFIDTCALWEEESE